MRYNPRILARMLGFQIALGLWGALATLASLVMAMARTPPDEARSNLSKWALSFGLRNPPDWLENVSADTIARRWAARTMALLIGIAIGYGSTTTLWTPTQRGLRHMVAHCVLELQGLMMSDGFRQVPLTFLIITASDDNRGEVVPENWTGS